MFGLDSVVGVERLPAIARNLQEMDNRWAGVPRIDISEYDASCVAHSGYTTLHRIIDGVEFATRLQISPPPEKINLILEIAATERWYSLHRAFSSSANCVRNGKSSTGRKDVDARLGGRIARGGISIFEGICVAEASDLLRTLCVHLHAPPYPNVCMGKMIYIDTCDRFSPEEIQALATQSGMDGLEVLRVYYTRELQTLGSFAL